MTKRCQSALRRDQRFTIRLTRDATAVADALAGRHGMGSRAAAIEYALRKVGREEGIVTEEGHIKPR